MKKLEILSITLIVIITILAGVLFLYQGFSFHSSQATSLPVVSTIPQEEIPSELISPPSEEPSTPTVETLLIPLEPEVVLEPQKPTYYIRINVAANTITVYGQDENKEYTVPVTAFVCSTGTATPHSRCLCHSTKICVGRFIR